MRIRISQTVGQNSKTMKHDDQTVNILSDSGLRERHQHQGVVRYYMSLQEIASRTSAAER